MRRSNNDRTLTFSKPKSLLSVFREVIINEDRAPTQVRYVLEGELRVDKELRETGNIYLLNHHD